MTPQSNNSIPQLTLNYRSNTSVQRVCFYQIQRFRGTRKSSFDKTLNSRSLVWCKNVRIGSKKKISTWVRWNVFKKSTGGWFWWRGNKGDFTIKFPKISKVAVLNFFIQKQIVNIFFRNWVIWLLSHLSKLSLWYFYCWSQKFLVGFKTLKVDSKVRYVVFEIQSALCIQTDENKIKDKCFLETNF